MNETYVDQLLGEIEVSPKSTPAELRAQADQLMDDFCDAVARPARLSAQAALLNARAAAIEARDEKRAALEDAEAAVREAEDAFAATEPGEVEAARRATEARHGFERARDAWEQAAEAKAEPAELVELDMRATSAARVDAHESAALTRVQAEREQARRAVEQARARAKAAREALQQAQAAIGAPLQADRPMSDRLEALVYTWPLRVLRRHQPGWELDSQDLAICRLYAEEMAGLLGVVPAAEAKRIADQAAEDVARRYRNVQLALPNGTVVPLGAALGGMKPR